MDTRVIAALLGAAALAVPTAAAADPGHGGHHGQRSAKPTVEARHRHTGKAKKAKPVMFIFKGAFTAPDNVAVVSGNAQARKGGFVGQSVHVVMSSAKVVAADANGDSTVDVSDVKDGDVVLVQARLPKGTKFAADEAVQARKVIDETNAPERDDDPTE
jgi:hypothetical protein